MTVRNVRYARNNVVVVHVDEDEVPHFAVIVEFLVTPLSEILFVCHSCVTVGYSKHHHAYQVSLTNDVVVLKHMDLHDYHPLSTCCVAGSSYSFVCVKYRLLPSDTITH